MRVLVAHNFYRQPGGEDQVFGAECALLRSFGHDVVQYAVSNNDIRAGGLSLALKTVWNGDEVEKIAKVIRDQRIEVAHFHNTLPLLSPGAIVAARRAGAAVVLTLHNYRLLCVNGLLYRDGATCTECVDRFAPWHGVVHACYRNSRAASGAVAAAVGLHRLGGTWNNLDAVIVLSRFAEQLFLQSGVVAERVFRKVNFVHPDPGIGTGEAGEFLFVGRLTEEKGVLTLLEAMKNADGARLRIVGDGPLRSVVESAADENGRITYEGPLKGDEVLQRMKQAVAIVAPSQWFEGMPRVLVEAFAVGTPAIVSEIGSLSEMVRDGETGASVQPGDVDELAAALRVPSRFTSMREAVRAEYLMSYTAEANYERLNEIYAAALTHRTR